MIGLFFVPSIQNVSTFFISYTASSPIIQPPAGGSGSDAARPSHPDVPTINLQAPSDEVERHTSIPSSEPIPTSKRRVMEPLHCGLKCSLGGSSVNTFQESR